MKRSPVKLNERIESLDIIRGFALLGIFLVNMPTFQWPQLMADLYMYPNELSATDQWIRLFFDVFVQAKFFTIFSFLFGLGFYLFIKRAEEKGLPVYRLFSRRLTVLAVFGILHLVFFWYGDILLSYALAGFLLIFFYKRKTKTILVWVFAFIVLLVGLLSLNFMIAPEVVEQGMMEQQAKGEGKLDEAIWIYQNANYGEWLTYRWTNEVVPILENMPFDIPVALFMFLLGLYAGKRGIFQDFQAHKPFVQRVWRVCFVVSLPFSIAIVLLHWGVVDFGVLTEQTRQVLVLMSGFTLSLFYIASILLLLQKDRWKKRLKPFGYAGRMALTNYITQTLIGVGIFTGLGLFGELNLSLGLFICFIVFPLQIVLSYYWLRRYRFGPLEWVWRSLTYGSFQPLKIRGKD